MSEEEKKSPKLRPPEYLWLTEKTVPKEPYKSVQEKWDAIFAFQELEHERVDRGFPPFEDYDLKKHFGFKRDSILREIAKPDYVNFCMARAKNRMGITFAKLEQPISAILTKLTKDISEKDEATQKKILELIMQVSDKFGFKDVDTSKAEIEEEFDTDAQVERALSLVEELSGKKPVLQRFVKKVMDGIKEIGNTDAGSQGQTQGTLKNNNVHGVHSESRPDKAVVSVPTSKTTPEFEKKIPVHDNGESGGEVGVAVG